MAGAQIDYQTATAGGLAKALAAGQVSALELFEEAVRTIEAKDGPINAIVVRDFDRARDAAKAADAALARGERAPLLGVPMTVKEHHHILGLPTTRGVAMFKGWMPSFEGPPLTRLREAGAVILGKTNVPPWLADWQSDNPIYGRTNNPHDLTRSPGGSSGGGAAALAAGMVPLECGSDIGGSIRVPAHLCGVFGHKPTVKLVPAGGATPPPSTEPGPPLDLSVVGPMARTASDLELGLSVIAGPDGDDAKAYRLQLPAPRHSRLGDYRVLVLTDHPLCDTDDEVKAVVEAAAEQMRKAGATVRGSSELLPDLAKAHINYQLMLLTSMSRGRPNAEPISAHGWMDLLSAQHSLRRQWARLFESFDVVLAPPFGVAAFPHDNQEDWTLRRLIVNGQETLYGQQTGWPGVATYPGLPATAAPLGKTRTGLPVGVQIIGPFLEDLTPIAVAGMLEREML
ncbi:MAG TPA: amidase family protein [Caulobacteraceae bacterium]|jgi:amidase|nr:amidase family protein [Caulobacteraceae bacterium]